MLLFKAKINRFYERFRTGVVVLLHDILMIPIAWLGAYALRFNLFDFPPQVFHHALTELPIVMLVQLAYYQMFGLYRGIWRFASMPDLVRIVKAVSAAVVTAVVALFFYNRLHMTPRSVFVLYGLLMVMLLGGARFVFRWFKDYTGLLSGKRVLIVGSGAAGESLIRDLLRHSTEEYRPMLLVDDDPHRWGKEVHGIRVAGDTAMIPALVEQHHIDLVMIAVPTANAASMRRIVSQCEQADVDCFTLPSLGDLASGRVSVDALRQVSLEDLLGRDPVSLDWQEIERSLQQKVVLVTGGAGSIGSELCRQIARLAPSKLIVLDHSEYSLYQLQMAFLHQLPALTCVGLLVDVTDEVAVNHVFQTHNIDTVFHAAAYKHVPMLETQWRAAIHNNVIGTLNVAQAAVKQGAAKFVLISTDKAVHPANIMGASKRMAEIFVQNYASPQTQFITVRFGNVLGSAGSVVPLFKQQIEQGGPITVTHPEIQRYFMTIPEASQLILQASVLGQGGEIFVLDMGEPMKIRELAEQMIQFSGLELGRDIDIEYVGLRPGEKLFEELFHQQEMLAQTSHHKILLAKYRTHSWEILVEQWEQLLQACRLNDLEGLTQLTNTLVPEYKNLSHSQPVLETADMTNATKETPLA